MASSSSSKVEQLESVWDVNFGCFRKNGILCPEPLQSIPPPNPSAEQQQTHTVKEAVGVRRKRNLVSSSVLSEKTITFKLFHCTQTQEHILAMIELGADNTSFYNLSPYVKNEKRKLEAREISIGNRVIFLVEGEIYEKADDKIKLTIQQRLKGLWTIELRRRNQSNKTEMFYSHEKVNRTFRSLNEVATFIGYNIAY